MKPLENIKKSLTILIKLNFTLRINIVGQMILKSLMILYDDLIDINEYQIIISKICENVLDLPDYVKTNHSTVAITFSLLHFIAEGRTEHMHLDNDLSYAYKISSDLARNEKTDESAFKVISKYI